MPPPQQDEESVWWVSGVNPGGACAPGQTPKEALNAFRITLHEVWLDCAVRCGSFGAFQTEVQTIFDSTTEDMVSEWQDAAQPGLETYC